MLLEIPLANNINVYSDRLKANKMKDSSTVSITHNPEYFNIDNLDASLKSGSITILEDLSDDYIVILDKKNNQILGYNIQHPNSSTDGRLVKDESNQLIANTGDVRAYKLKHSNTIELTDNFNTSFVHSLYRILSPSIRRMFNFENFNAALGNFFSATETVSSYTYGTLCDANPYLIVGTSGGGILIVPLLLKTDDPLKLYFTKKLDGPIVRMELFCNKLFCSNDDVDLLVVKFSSLMRHTQVKSVEGIRNRSSIIVMDMDHACLDKMEVPSRLFKVIPLIMLNKSLITEPVLKDFYDNIVGLVLGSGQLVLLDLSSCEIVFEHRFSDCFPVGLYFDKRGEFLNVLFENGDIDVFNVNVGNITLLVDLKARLSEDRRKSDNFQYQIRLFAAQCFTYERSINLAQFSLNYYDLLRDYRETYSDMRSFTNFTANPLINVTQAGSVFEFATQFFTNELSLSHIEYPNLKKGVINERPALLEDEKRKAVETPKSKTLDEGFQGIKDLRDLDALIEKENQKMKEQEEKSETVQIEQIPRKLQNILERNIFGLVKERIGEKPIKILEQFEQSNHKKHISEPGNKSEAIRLLHLLNYANLEVFSDPEDYSNLSFIKKKYKQNTFFILDYYPPVFDPTNRHPQQKTISYFLPSGLDVQAEMEIRAAFGEGIFTIDFAPGVQGVAESFSFTLPENFIPINNNFNAESPRRMGNAPVDPGLLGISRYISTNVLLSVISELIFIIKTGYVKVQPLIISIRTLFFERLFEEKRTYKPVSHKIMSMATLNDKLLVSAASHFGLNNIFDAEKSTMKTFFLDESILPSICFFWVHTKGSKAVVEQDPMSILNTISKFELYVISLLLFYLKSNCVPAKGLPLTREQVVNTLAPLIEIKVSMSYPFLVIPSLKVILETLPYISTRDNQKTIKKLFHSVVYFSLYYGLTFEPEDEENPTYINASLLLEELPSAKQIKEFVASLSQQSYEVRRGIRVHILKLLKLLGETDLQFILALLNEMVGATDTSKLIAYNAIDVLKYLVKFCETDFYPHVYLWAEGLMKSLNPNKPDIRKFCQKLSTSAMKSLLKRYSFCAFHKETQHFFVPGPQNDILIYDLRTAMRWKSLKGHSSVIDCLSVHDKGEVLASFSRHDKEVKLWKIGATGFFENLLRSSTELAKVLKVKENVPGNTELKLTFIKENTIEISAPKSGWKTVVN